MGDLPLEPADAAFERMTAAYGQLGEPQSRELPPNIAAYIHSSLEEAGMLHVTVPPGKRRNELIKKLADAYERLAETGCCRAGEVLC